MQCSSVCGISTILSNLARIVNPTALRKWPPTTQRWRVEVAARCRHAPTPQFLYAALFMQTFEYKTLLRELCGAGRGVVLRTRLLQELDGFEVECKNATGKTRICQYDVDEVEGVPKALPVKVMCELESDLMTWRCWRTVLSSTLSCFPRRRVLSPATGSPRPRRSPSSSARSTTVTCRCSSALSG